MTRLWSGERVDFEGAHFSLRDATINPRPKQKPLPLWLGGASRAAVRRTARYGSGWLAPLQSPEEAGRTVEAIREESRRIGRPIPDDHYGATIVFRIGAEGGPKVDDGPPTPERAAYAERLRSIQAVGEPGAVLERIRAFRTHGVTKFIAIPLARTTDEMIEQCQLLSREVIPHAND
jgi:alkanesulfonate monooxygenase SsuD/methylene tetrahydromethanopterin reductase-like flavin-dependent oxidoreductase (luciferase family)